MNIVNTLTLRHLKENKKRTVITVIGIIISVAMLTATCVSVTSLAALYARDLLYMGGEWHAALPSATAQQIETLEKNTDLKYVAIDIFLCRENAEPDKIARNIRSFFKPDKVKTTVLKRGNFGSAKDIRPKVRTKVAPLRRIHNTGAKVIRALARRNHK